MLRVSCWLGAIRRPSRVSISCVRFVDSACAGRFVRFVTAAVPLLERRKSVAEYNFLGWGTSVCLRSLKKN